MDLDIFIRESTILKGEMEARYGDIRKRMWIQDDIGTIANESLWWKDLMLLRNEPHGVMKKVTAKLGNGNIILFWKSSWLGRGNLDEQFLQLYLEINSKKAEINKMSFWLDGSWR